MTQHPVDDPAATVDEKAATPPVPQPELGNEQTPHDAPLPGDTDDGEVMEEWIRRWKGEGGAWLPTD